MKSILKYNSGKKRFESEPISIRHNDTITTSISEELKQEIKYELLASGGVLLNDVIKTNSIINNGRPFGIDSFYGHLVFVTEKENFDIEEEIEVKYEINPL